MTEQEQVVPIVHIARTIPKPWSAAGVQARRDMANSKAAVARAAAVAAQRVAMELAEDEEDDVEDEEEDVEVEPAAICDIVERGTTKEEAALLIKQQKDAFTAGARTRSQGNCYIMEQQAATRRLIMNFANHLDAHLILAPQVSRAPSAPRPALRLRTATPSARSH